MGDSVHRRGGDCNSLESMPDIAKRIEFFNKPSVDLAK